MIFVISIGAAGAIETATTRASESMSRLNIHSNLSQSVTDASEMFSTSWLWIRLYHSAAML